MPSDVKYPDNFRLFWFRFIWPNRGPIDFGAGRRIASAIWQARRMAQ
jgi:hypothetical protein